MMTITIYTPPILAEVRQRSHMEVQDIKDPEARDNARAGLDKMDELTRDLREAFGQVLHRCERFLVRNFTFAADNISGIPEAYMFEFRVSERRFANKADALMEAINGFVVSHILTRFYITVGHADFAQRHQAEEQEFLAQIDEILYTKLPPRP